jgi:hypothetical protein
MSEIAPHSDILELFQRDPLKLTREDLTAMIAKMRQSRSQFALGSMKAGSTKPPTAKQKQANELAKTIDLKDLGI